MKHKLQWARFIVQILWLALLLAGFFLQARIVIAVLLPGTFIFGNFFCGWVCPFGSAQELFGRLGRRLFKKRPKMPQVIQKYLQFSRYLLMALMLTGVATLFFETINSYKVFLGLGTEDLTLTLAVLIMISFLPIAIIFERPFCNYLCTEAVKFGILSFGRFFSIIRDKDKCVSCGKCDKACPMNIIVSAKPYVLNGQCINCYHCIDACPVQNTLLYVKIPPFWKRIGKNKSYEEKQ